MARCHILCQIERRSPSLGNITSTELQFCPKTPHARNVLDTDACSVPSIRMARVSRSCQMAVVSGRVVASRKRRTTTLVVR